MKRVMMSRLDLLKIFVSIVHKCYDDVVIFIKIALTSVVSEWLIRIVKFVENRGSCFRMLDRIASVISLTGGYQDIPE